MTPNESLDLLFNQSLAIRSGKEYQDFLVFVGKFKKYSAYNNMLVFIQKPNCKYYATKKDWNKKFKRTIQKGAHPMLILAPMHPVLFVFDVEDTEGEQLPLDFTKNWKDVNGIYKEGWLLNITTYLKELKILIKVISMHTNKGGSIQRKNDGFLITLNALHEEAGNFSTLIHELAHMFLGHLGSYEGEKFPKRRDLSISVEEIEAESVAYLVLQRLGLHTQAAMYLSFYNRDANDFDRISMDLIIKTVAKIEKMIKSPFNKNK